MSQVLVQLDALHRADLPGLQVNGLVDTAEAAGADGLGAELVVGENVTGLAPNDVDFFERGSSAVVGDNFHYGLF